MTRYAQTARVLCLLLIPAGIVSIAAAQKPVSYAKPPTHKVPIYPSRLPGIMVTRMWDWTTDTWNGDDKPYQQARNSIDQAVAADQNLAVRLNRYKVQAQSKPNDPLALFRWAYVAYQVMLTQKSRIAKVKALDGVQEAFYHTPSAHTYNYARMQFLIVNFYVPYRQAVPVAERLLKTNADDYLVNYTLASIYLESYASPDFYRAFTICNRLKHLYPKKASVYALTGEAYVLRWYQEKNPAFAQGVVENYNSYLGLAAPNDDFRPRAQSIIKEFEPRTKAG